MWTTENGFIPRNCKDHHQNGPTVGMATKATVVDLLIWEKARIYAHFAQHVDSSVCNIRTLYDSCSLLNKNRFKEMKIFSDSNETNWTLWQKDVMNSITNDKLREQALSNNAVRRSCKYVCFWQNLDLNRETRNNMGSAQVLPESSLAMVRSWPIAGN